MKYLPFENITYKSRLSQEEILKRLEEVVDTENHLRLFSFFNKRNKDKKFKGSINGNTFKMIRIKAYGFSSLPIIKGVVEEDFEYTKIQVKMRPKLFELTFIYFLLGLIALMVVELLINIIHLSWHMLISAIPVSVMLGFGYAIEVWIFKSESIPTKKRLAKIFEASVEQE